MGELKTLYMVEISIIEIRAIEDDDGNLSVQDTICPDTYETYHISDNYEEVEAVYSKLIKTAETALEEGVDNV